MAVDCIASLVEVMVSYASGHEVAAAECRQLQIEWIPRKKLPLAAAGWLLVQALAASSMKTYLDAKRWVFDAK
eukprot:3042268-Amphidinium_carterae.1